ncbi:MAG: transcriptional regulator NrdR [Bacillota bacterium]
MKCYYCGSLDTKVIDSRSAHDGIRRRRECNACKKRFTTIETVETMPVLVVKKDGKRESFNVQKIVNGIVRSCEKRPVTAVEIEGLASMIAKTVYGSLDSEISSVAIGEMVMDGLKELDEVAYVRFASVYRQFTDISSFMNELEGLLAAKKVPKK